MFLTGVFRAKEPGDLTRYLEKFVQTQEATNESVKYLRKKWQVAIRTFCEHLSSKNVCEEHYGCYKSSQVGKRMHTIEFPDTQTSL